MNADSIRALSTMFKISLSSLLVFVTIIALVIALVLTSRKLNKASSELNLLYQESRRLEVKDFSKIHAVNFPGYGEKTYRWKLYTPSGRRFRLKVAFDRVPLHGITSNPPNLLQYDVPQGEIVLTANIFKEANRDSWHLSIISEADGVRVRPDISMKIDSQNTDWLNEGGAPMVAGYAGVEQESVGDPFVLLSYRALSFQPPIKRVIDPNPTSGVLIWIEDIDQ